MACHDSDSVLDVDQLLGDVDDENFLVATESQSSAPTFGGVNYFAEDPAMMVRKMSLVNKLDSIARTGGSMTIAMSPISSASSGSRSSNLSPGVSSYLRQNLSSTPISAGKSGHSSRFDPRTYKKPTQIHHKLSEHSMLLNNANPLENITDPSFLADAVTPDFGSPITANSTPLVTRMNATFDRRHSSTTTPTLNSTFDRGQLNATFEKGQINQTFEKPQNATFEKPHLDGTYGLIDTSRGSPSLALNETVTIGDRTTSYNSTFTRRKSSNEERPPKDSMRRISKDSKDSHEEERLSNTSDGSMSHRLNDVGDVQLLAKMQEESLRQTVNNHKSSTISPSSECSPHSPSTGGSPPGNGVNHYRDHKQNQQYSSQDSLPDSPYSSQSLESQSAQGRDRLRRSMPNLNKIRGRGGIPSNAVRKTSAAASTVYNQTYKGLSRQHTSDPRLQANRISNNRIVPPQTRYGGPPSRGSSVVGEERRDISRERSTDSGFVRPAPPPSGIPKTAGMSRIARPVGSGIPRPGMSRLPAPTRSGIPKPNSQPGSRASSVGPRRASGYADGYQ